QCSADAPGKINKSINPKRRQPDIRWIGRQAASECRQKLHTHREAMKFVAQADMRRRSNSYIVICG
ncbi:MAG: hypothetical protein P4L75_03200, partial [Clostridia bacterium]|nr:hypothetical protein [Clostridia bacterium]